MTGSGKQGGGALQACWAGSYLQPSSESCWTVVSPPGIRQSAFLFGQQQGGDFSCGCPQQVFSLSPQLHSPLSIPFPLSAAEIMAQAHPTPLCTSIACTGQFRAQAPHSMHASGRARIARSSPSSNTACGQTCVQRLQLKQRSG